MRKALAELLWRLCDSREDYNTLSAVSAEHCKYAYATELAVFRLGGSNSLHAVRELAKAINLTLDS